MKEIQTIILKHKSCMGYWKMHHKEHAEYYHNHFVSRVTKNSENLHELMKFLIQSSSTNYVDFLNTFEVKYVIN